MKNISPPQKKIIIISIIVLLVFLVFWFFIYLPSKNTVARIKSELISVESQVRKIETIIGKTKSMDESMQLLIERYRALDDRFPLKEEESIRMLSRLSHKLNIELVSIKPQPKAAFLDDNRKEVEIDGRICQRVFVAMKINCSYKDLVKYIESLKQTLPAFITIEKLRVKKDGTGTRGLNVTLDINLYLLS